MMTGIMIDITIILLLIISFLAGRYITRILIYRYYSHVELKINGKTIKKITQRETGRIIKKVKDNPYFSKDHQ